MSDISDIREQINKVDARLVALLNERAGLAQRIGKAKQQSGTAVYDPARERVVLERIESLNHGPLSKGALEGIYACIITACRELQIR